jgi:multiple antibiotic resistance protein
MRDFWLCFVPLFVAVDAIGILPLFLNLTEDLDAARRRRVILQSLVTASVVALLFLLCGPTFLLFLGITVQDFMIAGGLLLLAISLTGLLSDTARHRHVDSAEVGAVPIGVPLITGPGVLTTCILLAQTYGKPLTAVAALLNIALAGVAMFAAGRITRVLGQAGTKTVSKIAGMLLAAISVMLIRRGLQGSLPAP